MVVVLAILSLFGVAAGAFLIVITVAAEGSQDPGCGVIIFGGLALLLAVPGTWAMVGKVGNGWLFVAIPFGLIGVAGAVCVLVYDARHSRKWFG